MIDIRDTWKAQPVETQKPLTLRDLELRAERTRRRIRRRNVALYAYAAFNIIITAWLLGTGKFPAFRAPAILMVGVHLFVVWQVWRRFSPRSEPLPGSSESVLQFHRQELIRQHAAASKAWLWYIAPFLPPFVWELAIWLAKIDPSTAEGLVSLRLFLMGVLAAVLFWSCVWALFSRHAARLELELERIDRVMAE
jgi:hypothetical protein